jgi:protease-4
MKVNPILSDIYRGEWLLNVHSILSFAPIISKLLAGDEVIFEKTGAALLKVSDKTGRRIYQDEDGGMEIPPGSIAEISMMGPVLKNGDFCTYGADEIVRALRFANEAKNIKGIVFHIDGPGGSVNAIGPFLQFAKEKKKPVIGLIDSAYSLHYWAAVSVCDRILADNDVSAGTGSVGVVLSFIDSRPVLEEKGYVFHDIYPEESKHKNEAFNLAREGKYDMIKAEHLSPVARKFQEAVKKGRPNLKDATGVLTGKTFNAELSMEYGMIDGIGTLESAKELIAILNELKIFTNN